MADSLAYYRAFNSLVSDDGRPRERDKPKMPNTQSSKKRLRQNVKQRLLNRSFKSNMRSTIRIVREAAAAGDGEKAQAAFRLAVKKLDRAASKNVIHRNAAARTKSRLSKLVKAAGAKA